MDDQRSPHSPHEAVEASALANASDGADRRPYEKPALRRLGLLRHVTRFTF
jgi:hypothetical protein